MTSTSLLILALCSLLFAAKHLDVVEQWKPRGHSWRPDTAGAFLISVIFLPVFVVTSPAYPPREIDSIEQAASRGVSQTADVADSGRFNAGLIIATLIAIGFALIDTSVASLFAGLFGGILILQATVFDGTQVPSIPQREPYCFELADHIPGARLEIDGVPIGTLPLTIDEENLFKIIPEKPPRPGWVYSAGKLVRESKGKQKLHETSKAVSWVFNEHGDHRVRFRNYETCRFDNPYTRSTQSVDVQVSVPGQTDYVFCKKHSDPRRRSVILSVETPPWRKQIKTLFDQARIRNYVVDDDWFDAYESWRSMSWDYLQGRVKFEPGLDDIIDQLAERQYHVSDVGGPDVAWQMMNTIARETVNAAEYDTLCPSGRAVELILPHLSRKQLFEHVADLIRTPDTLLEPFRHSIQYGHAEDGLRHFVIAKSFYLRRKIRCPILYWAPFIHACWKLHQQELNVNGEQDTSVQKALGPTFIQPEEFIPDSNKFEWAAKLGGSIFDEFLSRHELARHDPDREINLQSPWVATLIAMDSPGGQCFRIANSDGIFSAADRVLTENRDIEMLPASIASLCRAPSLAMNFRPNVEGFATHRRSGTSLSVRFEYLSRMWPTSTSQMFADVVTEMPVGNYGWGYVAPLTQLQPKPRFAVLTAIIDALRERRKNYLKPRKPNGNEPHSILNREIGRFNSQRMEIASADAARVFIEYWEDWAERYEARVAGWELNPETRPKWGRISDADSWTWSLRWHTRKDSTRHDHIEALGNHSDPRFRAAALPAIRHHPTGRRLKVLKKLLSDPDETVQCEAFAVHDDLERLRLASPPVSGINWGDAR